jgi:hypothetical protein
MVRPASLPCLEGRTPFMDVFFMRRVNACEIIPRAFDEEGGLAWDVLSLLPSLCRSDNLTVLIVHPYCGSSPMRNRPPRSRWVRFLLNEVPM